jgi:hypothetical protein
MADQDYVLDPERSHKRARVRGELLKRVLIVFRFARLTEADLIRRNDSIARVDQRVDCRLPRRGAEVLAVKQHGGFAVRICRLHVHIGHVERLALGGESEMLDGVRVVEPLQFRAVAGSFHCRWANRERERGADKDAEERHGWPTHSVFLLMSTRLKAL